MEDYYVTGTEFEIPSCPAYLHGECKVNPSIEGLYLCKDVKDCIIKNHMVHLSALVTIASRNINSAECIGAKACFNDFIVKS